MEKKAPTKSAPTKRDIKVDPITPDEFFDALKKVSRKQVPASKQTRKRKTDSD
jgi:hypothetical protein